MKLRRRGGRKLVIAPDGLAGHEAGPQFDKVLIDALVRAHRWRRQIEAARGISAQDGGHLATDQERIELRRFRKGRPVKGSTRAVNR